MAEREGLKSAYETSKQIVTLAAAIVTLTITLVDKFKPPAAAQLEVPWQLQLGWALYALAVLGGLWCIMAITGTHQAIDDGKSSRGASSPNVVIPAFIMVIAFFLALVFTICAGFAVVR